MRFWAKLVVSSFVGICSGYCLPYLLMFFLNITKGNGVNIDGEIFRFPAFILIVMVTMFCAYIQYKLTKKLQLVKKVGVISVFLVMFILLFANGIHLFV